MERRMIPAAAVVVALLGGCSEEASGCDAEYRLSEVKGEKRPVRIEPSTHHPGLTDRELEKALPSPEHEDELNAKVLNHLRQETVRMAGVIGETGPGRCAGEVDRPRGETVRCTVTYEGVSVPWLVTSKGMTSGSAGAFSQDFVYTAKPLRTLHTARSVYDWYAWETGKNGTTEGPLAPVDPRCDRLPEVFTAEPGKETGYFCQDVSKTCTDDVQHIRWGDRPIRAEENGDLSFLAG
ncbi:hypothetical protein O7599_36470 [Streptomyces sp. WMMC500]|uniref:hypothetical protein n=1 Tax=Streptomyces sp. WMMC500 TaxID=3015154 RepID=UPI00248B53AE|nr:hypothetical protein [Streptomyces sp. WMMC500]WBB60920.1 hypothetical protein O7599_36470 [Streptomyces sp. WMMC500]